MDGGSFRDSSCSAVSRDVKYPLYDSIKCNLAYQSDDVFSLRREADQGHDLEHERHQPGGPSGRRPRAATP